jgi:hypothetical protein
MKKNLLLTILTAFVAVLSQAQCLSISQDIQHPSCIGQQGSFQLTPSGGVAPYTYTSAFVLPYVAPNGAYFFVSGVYAGTYPVTVTDVNGCTVSVNVDVTDPTPFVVVPTITNLACNGVSTGAISLAVSGSHTNYQYFWSNGAPNSPNLTNLPAGDYSVTILDNYSCSTNRTFTVTEPDAITANISVEAVTCHGDADGSASFDVSGGTGAYSYDWFSGSGSQPFAPDLTAGNYTLIISDANECIHVSNFTVPGPASELALTATVDNVSCNGLTDGTITAMATGGYEAYSYSWSAPVNAGNTATNADLAAGTYEVTVTDDNGCTITETFTVDEPEALIASISQTATSCNAGSDGSATVTATGGTGEFTVLWSTESTATTITDLTPDPYTVTVTDENGCTADAEVTIEQAAAILVETTQTAASCFFGHDGTATVSASGGTGDFTVLWSTESTATTITELAANTYSVTVTDESGCTADAEVAVGQAAAIDFTLARTQVSCHGGHDGTATVNVSGGTGAYTYLWSTESTAAAVTNLAAGNYTITVTDENDCMALAPFNITEPAAIDNTTATAANVITANLAGASYQWFNCATETAIAGAASQSFTPVANGSYAVEITVGNCSEMSTCVAITTLGIHETAPLEIALYPNPTTGAFTIATAQALTVQISNAAGQIIHTQALEAGQTAIQLAAIENGMYIVLATDTHGNQSMQRISIVK